MESIIKWISSPKVILSAGVIVSAILVLFGLRKGFTAYINSERGKEVHSKQSTLTHGMFDAVKYAVLFGAFLAVLQINGVNVGSMVAGLGLMSAIVGLALQDALKDAIMGIHLITDHFFEVGDVVKYRDFEGMVVSFNMKTTKLQSIYDHSIMTICNRNISEIVKMSTWTDIDLPLAYEEKLDKVHSVLKDICEEIKKVKGITDCVYKGTQEFAESAVIYKIRFFCPPENMPELRRTAMCLIQTELEKNGITIPYRKIDIQ